MSKVRSLHGATAAEIFQSGLENLESIEGVALAVKWKNGSITAGWSNVDLGSLARMILVLDEAQRRRTFSGGPD